MKSANSTSDTQTHNSNKPAKLYGQKSKTSNPKFDRKNTATKFSTESIFPQNVSWETSKVAWQQCRSFSVKLLKFFRFKSENCATSEVFQKKVPKCCLGNVKFVSTSLRKYFWQNCRNKSFKERKNLEKTKKKLFPPIIPLNMLKVILRTVVKVYGQNFDESMLKLGEKAANSAKKLVKFFFWKRKMQFSQQLWKHFDKSTKN